MEFLTALGLFVVIAVTLPVMATMLSLPVQIASLLGCTSLRVRFSESNSSVDALINQHTVAGDRHNKATRQEINSENF